MGLRFLLALSALALAGAAQAQEKKRVAVINFDYATVHTYVAAIFGSNIDVGKGVADLLVERLVTSGVYRVMERKALDKILAEQNLSNSDRADPNTAAKLGRILGVDAIIMGSITEFGRDDKTTAVGGNVTGRITGRYGIGGVGRRQAKAVVALTARMVSTDTAEILNIAHGKGESTRSGTTLLGSGGGSTSAGGAYDMTSKNFAATIIGEATTSAVTELAKGLDQAAARLPAPAVANVEGLVADVSGGTLILNVGTRAGVRPGMKLSVTRTSREIRDPASGKVIRRVQDQVGEVVITEADEGSSVGKFTGPMPPKVGDNVKTSQ
jgi:curli biogenesis system outer membrane secretion channel CsgG